MQRLPLLAIPGQSFSIALDDNFYDIRIKAVGNIMAVDIVRNQTAIVTGMRAEANYILIPYRYLEDGNFIFVTQDDEYPWYEQFGITQYLYYLSNAELAELRNGA